MTPDVSLLFPHLIVGRLNKQKISMSEQEYFWKPGIVFESETNSFLVSAAAAHFGRSVVLVRVSIAEIEHHDQILGRERFVSAYTSRYQSTMKGRAGNQVGNVESGTESKGHEEVLFSVLSHLACFLKCLSTTYRVVAPFTVK